MMLKRNEKHNHTAFLGVPIKFYNSQIQLSNSAIGTVTQLAAIKIV